ncbi:formyl transferase [Streptomyces aureocirculatus]|uniref:formyl transferase n=1 Tax=Streptomyces aureocirculatus TaxID=67275 RepID=UPI0006922BBA|nr:formyl transferase [Streptomyces aureocirculatus]
MRVLVCAQRDLVVCVALNRLLPELGDHEVAVALNRPSPGDPAAADPLRRQRWFERGLIDEVVFPPLDSLPHPVGELLTFHHLSRRHGIEFRDVEHVNTGDGLAFAQAFQPDLILSVRFDLIFKEPVLSLPSLGILNIHPGALPEYAGLAAPMRTLIAGEQKLTSTLHVIDRGIDTGPVIASDELPLDRGRSLFWHLTRLYELGVELFLQELPGLAKGKRPPAQPQDRAQRHYHSKPTPQEIETFEKLGFRFLCESDYEEVVRRFGGTPLEYPKRGATVS